MTIIQRIFNYFFKKDEHLFYPIEKLEAERRNEARIGLLYKTRGKNLKERNNK